MSTFTFTKGVLFFTLSAILLLAAPVAVSACAVAYDDNSSDGSNIYVWATVYDYYDETSCSGSWTEPFTHTYHAYISVDGPAGFYDDYDYSQAANGGGSATAFFTVPAAEGEHTVDGGFQIDCSVGGEGFFQGPFGGTISVAPINFNYNFVEIGLGGLAEYERCYPASPPFANTLSMNLNQFVNDPPNYPLYAFINGVRVVIYGFAFNFPISGVETPQCFSP